MYKNEIKYVYFDKKRSAGEFIFIYLLTFAKKYL